MPPEEMLKVLPGTDTKITVKIGHGGSSSEFISLGLDQLPAPKQRLPAGQIGAIYWNHAKISTCSEAKVSFMDTIYDL